MNELTQDQVRELFDYRDGNLYWKDSRPNVKTGDIAGYVRSDGYRRIKINGKGYFAHRLVFLYCRGYLPQYLDHIDGNKSNNSIDNLRKATNQENCMNQKKTKFINGKSTSSKFKGVTWSKHAKKWIARIRIDGNRKHIGYYDSEIEAAEAYNKAAIELFGDYACVNIIDDEMKPQCL